MRNVWLLETEDGERRYYKTRKQAEKAWEDIKIDYGVDDNYPHWISEEPVEDR